MYATIWMNVKGTILRQEKKSQPQKVTHSHLCGSLKTKYRDKKQISGLAMGQVGERVQNNTKKRLGVMKWFYILIAVVITEFIRVKIHRPALTNKIKIIVSKFIK